MLIRCSTCRTSMSHSVGFFGRNLEPLCSAAWPEATNWQVRCDELSEAGPNLVTKINKGERRLQDFNSNPASQYCLDPLLRVARNSSPILPEHKNGLGIYVEFDAPIAKRPDRPLTQCERALHLPIRDKAIDLVEQRRLLLHQQVNWSLIERRATIWLGNGGQSDRDQR